MKKLYIYLAIIVVLLLLYKGPTMLRPSFFLSKLFKAPLISSIIDENINLRKKIVSLEAEIYSMRQNYVMPSNIEEMKAKVYSVYPFNTKGRIYISKGYIDKITSNSIVLFSDNVFVGKVISVSKRNSEVITIFDPKFSLPVRVGDEEINGLLNGGVNPKIKLIDKTKEIKPGDIVVTAEKDMPYGLFVGKISYVKNDNSGAFLEAGIDPPYSISDLRDVIILPIEN